MIKLLAITTLLLSSHAGISEDYNKTREEINTAIEDGNFAEVKSLLTQLMPELKANLKDDKVRFNEVKKSTEKEEAQRIKQKMDRKKEIYDSLDHLLNVSPAAVRARAGSIVKLLDEYKKLDLSV